MGQRLVVTIKENENEKMKIYYHWSGYTASAFATLDELWNKCIKPLKKAGKTTDEILLGIIHFLEQNVDEEYKKWITENFPTSERCCHGGIGYFNKDAKYGSDDNLPNKELEYIQSLYPGETFATEVDRNDGLVYMSKDGMADCQMWSEGDASIDLATETFSNDINWVYHSKDEFVAGYSDGEDSDNTGLIKEFDNMSTYEGDGSDLFGGRCDDIVKKANRYMELVGNGYQFKDAGGHVWEGLA